MGARSNLTGASRRPSAVRRVRLRVYNRFVSDLHIGDLESIEHLSTPLRPQHSRRRIQMTPVPPVSAEADLLKPHNGRNSRKTPFAAQSHFGRVSASR